ncbi:hypothetical protein EDEG_01736 [Edhazardia aedis USNM 41457]|uniref:Protein kinase domain-containing protein n=1 Tax=Edhazardia aedis (strain USNM 41457) TaxID=1003232 RepID=J9D8Z2_EDHAE|nr:hypothetical protein EDEG_01736 [Edhazardia aedis USNM 41457]|eukprot:EJW03969.1 hypothetical protein EDEG_01736 [Edhazardia aedis USNM 41457]
MQKILFTFLYAVKGVLFYPTHTTQEVELNHCKRKISVAGFDSIAIYDLRFILGKDLVLYFLKSVSRLSSDKVTIIKHLKYFYDKIYNLIYRKVNIMHSNFKNCNFLLYANK